MRIGIFVQSFPVPSETFIATKITGLIKQGHDVKIFTNRKSLHWERFKTLDVEDLKSRIILSPSAWHENVVFYLFHFARILVQKLFISPVAVWKLWRHVLTVRHEVRINPLKQFINKLTFAGEKLDVLHIEFDFQAYPLVDLKQYLNCKLVLSGRGSVKRTSVESKFPNFYSVIHKYVDHYHFISEYLHAEAKSEGLSDAIPVSLIEPAIDLSLFTPQIRKKSQSITLITIARLSWAKGYEFAIDAIAIIHRQYPDIKYRILGEGDYQEAIALAIAQQGLDHAGVVEFMGSVKREDVPGYLQRADIMIHPALEEGFCNAVIEAQAMKVPVVCSDAGGLPENVADGVTGYVVSRRDSRAMAARVIELIQDSILRDVMGEQGRNRVLKKFNIEDQILRFHQMYQSLNGDR